jgi:hypothetical protein
MVRKLKQPSTFRLWQMYESDRHRGNAGKNEPFGVMGTFVVRLAMPVKGEMRRFIHEAEDLVVFAPDLYKLPKARFNVKKSTCQFEQSPRVTLSAAKGLS